MPDLLPGDRIRIKHHLNGVHGDRYENDWYCMLAGPSAIPYSEILTDMNTWLSTMLGLIDNWMSNSVSTGFAVVDKVGWAGVYNPDSELSTAKITTLANIGTFVPTFTPAITTDEYNPSVPFTASLKTSQPKTTGRKFFSGFSENALTAGLFQNHIVTAVASLAVYWLLGPTGAGAGNEYEAGVISMIDGDFFAFTSIGMMTNIPGSRDSRKIGRGL